MRKILAAFDGLKFSESTRDYAIEMAKQNDANLVGLFLEDMAYHSYKIYDMITEEGGGLDTKRKHLNKKDAKIRAAAVANFETACRKAGLQFIVHKDRNVAIQELLKESIYADLLIIDREENMSHHTENVPTYFIRELLPDVQCPVMLVPHKFKPVDKLILLFDGEPSSVLAIKMLSYTMSALKKYPTEVVTVNMAKQKAPIPEGRLMKEFMQRHFPDATYTALKGLAESEITSYLKTQKGMPLVVLGAYRRSRVSRWFRASMADTLMKEFKFPLFIAHNK
jgi:nucleotide-binding universal stress UspA family protein